METLVVQAGLRDNDDLSVLGLLVVVVVLLRHRSVSLLLRVNGLDSVSLLLLHVDRLGDGLLFVVSHFSFVELLLLFVVV